MIIIPIKVNWSINWFKLELILEISKLESIQYNYSYKNELISKWIVQKNV